MKENVDNVSDDIFFQYPYSLSLFAFLGYVNRHRRDGGLFFSEDGCQPYILPLVLKTVGGAIWVSSCREQITVSNKNEVDLSAGARSIRVSKQSILGPEE